MGQVQHNINLNSHQLEILKLFSREMDDTDLIEIKRLIVAYLGKNITEMADDVWETEKWDSEKVNDLLNTRDRTFRKSKRPALTERT